MRYIINAIHVYRYEDGPDGVITGTEDDNGYNVRLSSNREGILRVFADHVGVPVSEVEVGPTEDDPSRIEASRMETQDGFAASPADIEQWKAGARRLWSATYTAYVVCETPADMTA